MKQKILELQKLYRIGASELQKAGIDDAVIDAWYLLEFVTGISKASYFADPYRKISEEEADRYLAFIEQRKRHIPLQHLTGFQNFMGYDFSVNEHVLIPRQDTECLVEEALKVMKSGDHILDMCTGSGCILVSLLKMSIERKHMTDLRGVAVDISAEALKVAKRNAETLLEEPCITSFEGDLFEALDGQEELQGPFDLIVSNPPYICTEEIEKLQEEVRLHDPFIALDGKEDGLFFYRRIINKSRAYLKSGGWLMFEIGYDQGKSVPELMKEAGFTEILVKKDLAGLDRVVTGRYNVG